MENVAKGYYAKHMDLVVLGETNLDLILYGIADPMPLERELLASGVEITLGGSSSILAHNLAVLGARVGFVSEVGEDHLGRIAATYLEECGVGLTHFRRKAGSQTGLTVLLPHGNRRHILTYPGVMAELTVSSIDPDYLRSARHVHISSLFLQTGLHAGLPQLLAALRRDGITISLDTNDDPSGEWGGIVDAVLPHIDLLLPNEGELLRIARKSTLDEALETLAAVIPLIAVKRGAAGALVLERGRRASLPPITVEPVDTIGAGDSFNAGFLNAWLHGAGAEEAARMGNLAGALSTLRAGGVNAFRDSALREQFFKAHGCS